MKLSDLFERVTNAFKEDEQESPVSERISTGFQALCASKNLNGMDKGFEVEMKMPAGFEKLTTEQIYTELASSIKLIESDKDLVALILECKKFITEIEIANLKGTEVIKSRLEELLAELKSREAALKNIADINKGTNRQAIQQI